MKATDPLARELRNLQSKVSANTNDSNAAVRLARRYFGLAMSEGDPRYVGYAEAALKPWWTRTDAPVDVLVARALLKQYKHDFGAALSDFASAGAIDPGREEIWSWRAALHLVEADYSAAAADCEQLRKASELGGQSCRAWVDGITGKAAAAYQAMSDAYRRETGDSPSGKVWTLTRLAELALRLGRNSEAEQHFKTALAQGVTDLYLLGAYADFLLDAGRPAEVVPLLKDWVRSDILLLRLAIAEKAINAKEAAGHIDNLRARFKAAALRGDKLHLQEEARFNLALIDKPDVALRIAIENYATQREPRDARTLLEAALAERNPGAAKPALDWLERSGHEDPIIRSLAVKLNR